MPYNHGNMPLKRGNMPSCDLSDKTGSSQPADEARPRRPVDLLFGSGARVDVLWCLMNYPDQGLELSEIVRATGRSLKDVQRAIKILESLGLVRIDHPGRPLPINPMRKGRTRYYLGKPHPWIASLRMFLEQSVGSLLILREFLASVPDIDVAFVFGSYALAEQRPDSDIDVVIIGRQTLRALHRQVMEIEKRLGRNFQVMIFSPEDWRDKFNDKSHFVYSLMFKPRVFLVGDNERLERITSGSFDSARAAIA
jgi:predicted nucleotidyltransferase